MIISPVFQLMMDEHRIIERALNYSKTLDGLWMEDVHTYTDNILKLTDFFKEYSDAYHHNKEEVDLFKELIRQNEMLKDGIVGEFIQQHEDFRDYVRNITESANHKDYGLSFKLLMEYREELLMHIEAEDDELFPMAEGMFSDSEKETMYFRFQDIDRELGVERKIRFENWVDTISG